LVHREIVTVGSGEQGMLYEISPVSGPSYLFDDQIKSDFCIGFLNALVGVKAL
jgi:hypothetical protein